MAQMGRPRNFDRDHAVEQALHLFWEHGYDATSLAQLKAGLGGGISAPSFYAAFGSKEALFDECVQRYLATYAQVTECLWDDTLPPREAIETALRQSTRMQCEDGHPKGCMVALGVMSAPSPENARVADALTQSRARTRAGIVACVERAIRAGQLPDTLDAPVMATVFDSFLQGVSILARDDVAHATLDAAITQLMQTWEIASARVGRRVADNETV
ncbi:MULTISPECIES: TetR/AcrR family transcriptional regulator [Pseudomonas]|jgi:AcrR family transcriptional regulator|uniref:Transcriptional regulator, TetR family n=2 Tax=Pseudomonas fluorescens TaxID=294 RepID=A0ABY1T4R4_PSEFL|nr:MULTISPECIES: TetR/AcrR family transcriptional regulator [Pseudomonas]MCI4601936.1 TetR/AcrR family transcriptional regulator [Pseudomonas fluorescens]MDD5441978.1 TetR/AcrR family transcriptional regulator [Pseudomonas fluorescens]OEC73867.1 TetR family transcriptional regulator [Pseudomonas sp. AP19]OPB17081.1 TetR family transcriptional regulator [Pseudomonas fluorescens]PQB00304.1 TetR family transcriptional regulator [Pseudomonas fluorescens]